jgi:hypothetical protein
MQCAFLCQNKGKGTTRYMCVCVCVCVCGMSHDTIRYKVGYKEGWYQADDTFASAPMFKRK